MTDGVKLDQQAIILPTGTNAERPASPVAGMQRWNTDAAAMEYYNGSTWSSTFVAPYTASYVVVGGGSGATGGTSGVNYGCGAAGGTLRSGSSSLYSGFVYTVTVGGGGAGSSAGPSVAGGTSSISGYALSVSATGGFSVTAAQRSGGSNADFSGAPDPGTAFASAGGGAGAAQNGQGYNGGSGANTSITGSSQTFGGGGGGSGASVTGSGGAGGGGAGSNGLGGSGDTNTGGGGGGSGSGLANVNGGSGVVFISMLTSRYSGVTTGSPTVTTSGSNTILRFTQSGSYTG